jgi:hypothetical protein
MQVSRKQHPSQRAEQGSWHPESLQISSPVQVEHWMPPRPQLSFSVPPRHVFSTQHPSQLLGLQSFSVELSSRAALSRSTVIPLSMSATDASVCDVLDSPQAMATHPNTTIHGVALEFQLMVNLLLSEARFRDDSTGGTDRSSLHLRLPARIRHSPRFFLNLTTWLMEPAHRRSSLTMSPPEHSCGSDSRFDCPVIRHAGYACVDSGMWRW